MLIDSPRLRPGDREAWERASAGDARYAQTLQHRRRVDRSEARIVEWTAARRGYVATSWGKDSVCLADLACAITDWPLVWIRVEPIFNPDCEPVRDAFLAIWPQARYDEITTRCRVDPDGSIHATGTLQAGIKIAQQRYGTATLLGLRGAESADRRRIRETTFGETDRMLSPLIDWSGADVFGYLADHDLPIHPVYAMSAGGIHPRERLRVAALGGERGRGMGRREWEQMYYPEFGNG